MIRVIVADDHPLVRAGLLGMLRADDIEIVGSAENGQQAIDLVNELEPDVVLMDLIMPVADGVTATRAIKESHPDVRVIVLTTAQDPARVNEALAAGANGYLLKDVEPALLLDGIRSAPAGGVPLSPSVASRLLQPTVPAPPTDADLLTPRQVEILRLAANGYANKQIARALAISEKTVKVHFGRIFQRISVTDRTQAAVWAVRNLDVSNVDVQPTPL